MLCTEKITLLVAGNFLVTFLFKFRMSPVFNFQLAMKRTCSDFSFSIDAVAICFAWVKLETPLVVRTFHIENPIRVLKISQLSKTLQEC